jgi:hypothetical protein
MTPKIVNFGQLWGSKIGHISQGGPDPPLSYRKFLFSQLGQIWGFKWPPKRVFSAPGWMPHFPTFSGLGPDLLQKCSKQAFSTVLGVRQSVRVRDFGHFWEKPPKPRRQTVGVAKRAPNLTFLVRHVEGVRENRPELDFCQKGGKPPRECLEIFEKGLARSRGQPVF